VSTRDMEWMAAIAPFLVMAGRSSGKVEASQAPTHPLIRLHDDPILKQVCDPVPHGADVSAIVTDMRDVMKALKGAGLAAPQAGHAVRVVIVGNTVMVNPVIVWASPATGDGREGCLSYPGVFTTVTRSHAVAVDYTDDRGKRLRWERFIGWDARVVQHEIDHLNGICRVGDAWRKGGAA
jgi:peptide deformylase